MGKTGCCIPNCQPLKEHGRHRFANPNHRLELFQQWLRIINNPSLGTLSNEKIYASCRVCDKHFVPEDFGPNRTLKKTAYPKLFLSVSQSTSSSRSNLYDGLISDDEYETALSQNSYDDPLKISVTEANLCDSLNLDTGLWPEDEYRSPVVSETNEGQFQSGAISSHVEVSVEDQLRLKRRFLLNKAKILSKSVLKIKRKIRTFKNARRKYDKFVRCEFNFQDKASCSNLYKLNPSTYRILQTICMLPHTKNLRKFS